MAIETIRNNVEKKLSSSRWKKPRIVEIIGSAGAGKTTLSNILNGCNKSVYLDNFPDVRKVSNYPFFIRNGFRLLPALLRLNKSSSRQLTRREFAWLSILYGWAEIFYHQPERDNKTIILDQGPLYLIAELRLFGPDYLRQASSTELWKAIFDRWSCTLDMVIWLDASNEVLLDRIKTRKQEHIVKAETAPVVYEFVERYRREYEAIISTLSTTTKDLRVLHFNTGQLQPQEIADQFLSKLSCPEKAI